VINQMRYERLDQLVLAAFPTLLCLLAALGFARLPKEWWSWCLGLLVVALVETFVMDNLNGVPHPRLAYMAYPGIYLLAANGVRNLWAGTERGLVRHLGVDQRYAQIAALVVAVACLVPVAIYGNGLLWGDPSADLRFHYLTF
jgi:hypothetical protein